MNMYRIYVNHKLHAIFMEYSASFDYLISLYRSTGNKDMDLYKVSVSDDGFVISSKICSSDEFLVV